MQSKIILFENILSYIIFSRDIFVSLNNNMLIKNLARWKLEQLEQQLVESEKLTLVIHYS